MVRVQYPQNTRLGVLLTVNPQILFSRLYRFGGFSRSV